MDSKTPINKNKIMDNLNFRDIKSLISGILERNACEIPNSPAVISDDEILSHKKLYDLVQETILDLESIGVHPGHRVALRFDNHIKHLIFHLALLKMEVTQLSINPNDVLKLQKKTISAASIGLIIQDVSIEDILINETLHISKNWEISPINSFIILHEPMDNNPAIIYSGSGTTGEAKVLTVNTTTLAHRFKHNWIPGHPQKGERLYCFSELYFAFPRHQIIRALIKGITLFLPRIKPKCIVSFCTQHQIDHLVLTGSQATHLLSHEEQIEESSYPRLPELKSLALLSSLITEPVRQKILTRITGQLFIYYGTNEFGSVSMATPEDIHKYPGTVGRAFPGVEIAIVDDNGNPCSTGTIGNILLKSSGKMANYIGNPEATQKAFTKEGYYPGDMGRLLEDGNLIFEGRKDDMMIFSGVNIYPGEIESILEAHPNVVEAAVFPLNTETYENIPFAVVKVYSKIKEIELLRWCTSELGWRSPKRIFFIEELPRNEAGKVLKRVLSQKVIEILGSQK